MSDLASEARFSITSSFEEVAKLAEEVGTLCGSRSGVDSETADAMRLCLAEALNNIVEHAYDGANGKPIFADVKFSTDRLEVVLVDEGKPMPAGHAPTGDYDPDLDDLDSLPEGGFGWMLIRSQMDEVDYDRREGCNVLRLMKHLVH